MKTITAAIGMASLLSLASGGQAPAAAPPMVQFGLERPAAGVSYRFTLREDGSGTYRATYPPMPPSTPGETVETPLMLHEATVKKIFDQARSTLPLHGNCETKVKNIAQTGVKTLTYTSAAATVACTWNYSDKSAVSALQDEFTAMAETLDAGRKLTMDQRFDRLGLDRDMTFLVGQVKEGHAQGLENITPVLQSIVEDVSLLERVRAQAKALLQASTAQR